MLEARLPGPKNLHSRLTRAAGSLRGRDWPRLILFAATRRETAYCTHLVLAALLFSPFLLFGHVFAGNQDFLLENYPMLLLAKHDFWHGSLGLWNPYAFSGVPQAAEANTPLLFPENWLLFLVPTRFFFSAVTFVAFIKVWLIGVAAYRFYCAELLNRRWALFASIALQLSGLTLFFLGTYVGLSIELYYLILLALIWTAPRRSALANYISWSLVTIMMLMAGDIAHSAYALLSAGFLVLYRCFSRRSLGRIVQFLALFTASSATALAVFAVRLLPTLRTAEIGSSLTGCCEPNFSNASFLIARYFDSEILGINFADSLHFIANTAPLLKGLQLHAMGTGFFGVSAVILAIWMLSSEKSPKTAFWSIFVVVGLSATIFAQPFDAFTRILLSPIYHILGLQIFFLIGLPALAGFGGMSVEQSLRRGRLSRLTIEFVVFAIIVAALFILMILIRNVKLLSPNGSNWARIVVCVVLALSALVLWVRQLWPSLIMRVGMCALAGTFVASFGAVLFYSESNAMFQSHMKNLAIELCLFSAVGIALTLLLQKRSELLKLAGPWCALIALPACLVVMLYPWTTRLYQLVPHDDGVILAALGALRFLLGVAILFMAMNLVQLGRLPRRAIYIVALALAIFELVPAGKIHDQFGGVNPFYRGTLYPAIDDAVDTDGQRVDFSDYRLNFPNTFLRLPFYNKLFGSTNEVCASINVAYAVRSYGGYTDSIPTRNSTFAANWGTLQQPTDYCIYANQQNGRFLDLAAVGYQYDAEQFAVVRRPDALSRFILFTNFEVIADDGATLKRLKEPSFQPLRELVLKENPGLESNSSVEDGENLAYTEISADHIELTVHSKGAALVLFDDSFDDGWKAKVNGHAQRIFRANYNFMAVPIPAGESHIVLTYWPAAFEIGAICAAIGLMIFGVAFAIFVVRRIQANRIMAAVQ
jgi:hypothetical protein